MVYHRKVEGKFRGLVSKKEYITAINRPPAKPPCVNTGMTHFVSGSTSHQTAAITHAESTTETQ